MHWNRQGAKDAKNCWTHSGFFGAPFGEAQDMLGALAVQIRS